MSNITYQLHSCKVNLFMSFAIIIWLKSAKKKVSTLLEHIKEAIKSFLSNIKEKLLTSAKTIGSTIANAIFGPVASVVQKIWTMISLTISNYNVSDFLLPGFLAISIK